MKKELNDFRMKTRLCGDADVGFEAGWKSAKTIDMATFEKAVGAVWESYVKHGKTFLPHEIVNEAIKSLGVSVRGSGVGVNLNEGKTA